MKYIANKADGVSRREFVSYTARAMLGVSLLPAATQTKALAATDALRKPTAKNVIYLYMSGGMTHLDTFDPKPGHENGGPVKAIPTSADGLMISEYLPGIAAHGEKIAVVRTLSSTQGAHDQGNYYMHTSYTPRGAVRHPGMASWLLKLDGRRNTALPGSIRIGGGSRGADAGFLESKYAPLVLGNPNEGLKNSKIYEGLSEKEFKSRLELSNAFEADFHNKYDNKKVRSFGAMYDDAIRVMYSEDLKAFDLTHESDETREMYGQNNFGQGVLLARRLVEHDVRFVEVTLGGWDNHGNIFNTVPQRAGQLDQAVSALMTDLDRRGMLQETLIVLTTEFGRTPRINGNNGRDHWPKGFSAMLAGGGIKGGQAWGKTDEGGANIVENMTSIPDFNATIAHALGLPTATPVDNPLRRPFTVANKGVPIPALFG